MMGERDPRARRLMRHGSDPLAAAVRLELSTDAMRAAQLERGLEPITTAAEFAAALGPVPDDAGLPSIVSVPDEAPLEAAAVVVVDGLGYCCQYGAEVYPQECPRHGAQAVDLDDPPIGPHVAGGQVPGPAAADEHLSAQLSPPIETAAAPEPAPVERSFSNALPGWRSRHDPTSRAYGIRSRLPGSAPIQEVMLPTGPVLDQAAANECVGCGIVDAINTLRGGRPPLGLDEAAAVYRRALDLDEIPGTADTGTSVLAGLTAAVERGDIGGYLWAFGTRDIAQALIQRQTAVVVGVPWLSGMFDTGPGGLVELRGDDEGLGHCLAVVGIKLKGPQGQPGPFFVWQNSAGASYGDGGLGYVHHRDLAALLHGVGEAAIPTLEPQAAAQ